MTQGIDFGSRGAHVHEYQAGLVAIGYDPGPTDGIVGRRTVAASRQAWDRYEERLLRDIPEELVELVLTKAGFGVAGAKVIDYGSRGAHVRTFQRALQRLGFKPGPVDGVVGRLTLEGARRAWEAYEDALLLDIPDELVEVVIREAKEKEPEPLPPVPGLQTIGVWSGHSSLRRQGKDVRFMLDHGINRLDLMANNHAGWRGPHHRFNLYDREATVELAARCHEAGIEFHLTSWIMPHERYLHGAAEALIPLAEDTAALSTMFDGEEPWTRARDKHGRRLSVENCRRAGHLVAELFADRTGPLGVTGIGYVGRSGRFAGLAAVCDYTCCQAYLLHVPNAPKVFFNRYADYFGKPVVVGYAAYPQKRTPRSKLKASLMAHLQCIAYETPATAATGWALRHVRHYSGARAAIDEFRAQMDRAREAHQC